MRTSARLRVDLGAFGPRNQHSAARTAAVLTTVATGVTTVFAFLEPVAGEPAFVNAIVPVALAATAIGLILVRSTKVALLCLFTPIMAATLIVALDLATRDASAAAQVFFCVPVLYAASQLRRAATAVVTGCALAGNAIVSLSFQSTQRAFTDVAYVGVTLVLIAALLAQAGVTQDRLNGQLRARAAVDSLTGLVTRRVLDDATKSAISSIGAGTGLVLIDVDRFKTVNDAHGHPVGDDALSHIAAVVGSLCRSEDVVARMGGDEIAVLMPGCTYEAGLALAEELVGAVRDAPLPLGGGSSLALSISAGVSHAPEQATQVRGLYAAADAALYQAKRAGRGRVGQLPLPAGTVL